MRGIVKTAVAAFAAFVIVLTAAAQQGAEEPATRDGLIIEAGHTRSRMLDDGGFLKQYSGGVHAWTADRDAELTADVAQYNSQIGEGRFYGSAAFRDSTRHLNADTLIYYDRRGEVRAIGNVLVTEVDREFRADWVTYWTEDRLVLAQGHVVVRDDSLKASVTGGRAVFNDSTGYGMVAESPVMIREDELGTVITVTCRDTLEIVRAEDIIRLWEDVVIRQDSLTARGSFARYEGTDERFTLTGSPEVIQIMHDRREETGPELRAESVVTGDTIRVHLHDREIEQVEVAGAAASVIAWHDSTGGLHSRSILESTSMALSVADNRIAGMIAAGRASSFYYQREEEDTARFVNKATGDTLRFFFDEGRIERLRISGVGGGGAKGKYYEYSPQEDEPADEEEDPSVTP